MRTRKPTGLVPPPLVLVEGEEKAGKTYTSLLLTRSQRVGDCYVIDLGEGSADEYGAIPGVNYSIVEHDGSYASVLQAVADVHAEATRAKEAGEKPTVLIIDSMTDEWAGLKDWASERAAQSKAGRAALAKDPNAEVRPTMNLWNDAAARHRRLMRYLLTFPGIAVMTARGGEVAEVRDGKPVEGVKTWSVDAHKSLGYDATLWVRLRRGSAPLVVGCRSVHVGLRAGADDPLDVRGDHDDDLLEYLIFDVLKYDPAAAGERDVRHLRGGELSADERAAESIGVDGAGASTPERRKIAQAYADEALTIPGDREGLRTIRERALLDDVLALEVSAQGQRGPLGALLAHLATLPPVATTEEPEPAGGER